MKDELIQYIVINSALDMSPGKIGAQCGHAVSLMCMKYCALKRIQPVWPPGGDLYNKIVRVESWAENNYTKIIKKAKGKQFQALKELGGEFVVVDLGRTELDGENETAIGFWPMRREECPKELEKLRLL